MNTAKKVTGPAAGHQSGGTQKPSADDQAGVFVRLNAQITETEHQKLKIHAAKNKTTISDLLRRFIAKLPD